MRTNTRVGEMCYLYVHLRPVKVESSENDTILLSESDDEYIPKSKPELSGLYPPSETILEIPEGRLHSISNMPLSSSRPPLPPALKA